MVWICTGESMNANELAERIEQNGITLCVCGCSTTEVRLIVTALRQYAALEWLWRRPTPRVHRIGDGTFAAYSGTDPGYGTTATEAIDNLRAKLEPPHEHVWKINNIGEIVCIGSTCGEELPWDEANRRLNAVPA